MRGGSQQVAATGLGLAFVAAALVRGILVVEEPGRVVRIQEKPADPASPYAVTGCYVFDSRVFEIIRGLETSERGELEITDVNNRYIEWGEMGYRILDGWWTDAGTIPSLHRAHRLVSEDTDNRMLRPDIPPRGASSPSPEKG